MLNPIGYIRDNYNFNKTLRRITLLIDKVENDINLFEVYKNLLVYKNSLDKIIKFEPT
jgi:tRNA (Thr-GGU) A37 N-methylase